MNGPVPPIPQYPIEENVRSGSRMNIVSETSNSLIAALQPVVTRVRTDVCWVVNHRQPPRSIKELLTEAKLLNHVNGGPRYGVAPIKPGSSVTRIGLLDFDSHKGEFTWAEMKIAVLKVTEALERLGASAIPFKSSGGQGVHLYVIWANPQDAYSVRCFLRKALKSAGFSDGTGEWRKGRWKCFPSRMVLPKADLATCSSCPWAVGRYLWRHRHSMMIWTNPKLI
ncbi:TOTE conflict system archaeo-eukaryotic primase domain-containing protein [Nitrosospira briensis]|uniref:TOTE conflict system archaeo-eukaryotic primase domain-containing protein n=1 Tax=Nitrosospira briensis TaxID=35799 RepID=UPI003527F9CA